MYSAPVSYNHHNHWATPAYQTHAHGPHYHNHGYHTHTPAYQSYAPAYQPYASSYQPYASAYQPYASAYTPVHNYHNVHQTVGNGNYGYGVYAQDDVVHRNLYSGRQSYEREVDFVPVGNQYQPYTGYPAEIHQHYVR
ncbi:hypothetical protein I4U23_004288 [Adineta vaga]|nr:hypothetical protein I4U23_004288 [Adineta vaga]